MVFELLETRVVRRRMEALDVVSFRLAGTSADAPLPAFQAGAHIDIQLPNGLTRKYSLLNDPAAIGVYEIAVKLEPASRGGSRWLHENVSAGDLLHVGPPQNLFPLATDTGRSILLAAGIGITPILAMMRTLLREGRQFELHYFSRSPEHAAYSAALTEEAPAACTTIHVGLDAASTETVLDHVMVRREATDHVYFCGPPGFMAAAQRLAAPRFASTHVHYEHFSAPACSVSEGDGPFEVELARTGKRINVPAGKSITDVLFEHSIPFETSCEAGICGICRTRVVSGVPAHRDTLLSLTEKARNDCMLPCVSRSYSERLVLDI